MWRRGSQFNITSGSSCSREILLPNMGVHHGPWPYLFLPAPRAFWQTRPVPIHDYINNTARFCHVPRIQYTVDARRVVEKLITLTNSHRYTATGLKVRRGRTQSPELKASNWRPFWRNASTLCHVQAMAFWHERSCVFNVTVCRQMPQGFRWKVQVKFLLENNIFSFCEISAFNASCRITPTLCHLKLSIRRSGDNRIKVVLATQWPLWETKPINLVTLTEYDWICRGNAPKYVSVYPSHHRARGFRNVAFWSGIFKPQTDWAGTSG